MKNCKAVRLISILINFYFITFIIYLFITLYSLYTFFDIILFHNKQGSKLQIKKKYFQKGGIFITKSILFSIVFTIIFSIILFHVFKPIYTANELIISYGIHPFDICSKNPQLWKYIKTTFIFTSIFSNFLIGYFIYNRFLFNLYSLL